MTACPRCHTVHRTRVCRLSSSNIGEVLEQLRPTTVQCRGVKEAWRGCCGILTSHGPQPLGWWHQAWCNIRSDEHETWCGAGAYHWANLGISGIAPLQSMPGRRCIETSAAYIGSCICMGRGRTVDFVQVGRNGLTFVL